MTWTRVFIIVIHVVYVIVGSLLPCDMWCYRLIRKNTAVFSGNELTASAQHYTSTSYEFVHSITRGGGC